MSKLYYLVILSFFVFTSTIAQKERLENKLMNCFYEAFEDQGKAFKRLMTDYEALLISEGILEDSSGKSYYKQLETMVSSNSFGKTPSKVFMVEFNTIELPDVVKAQKCSELVSTDSLNTDGTKIKALEAAFVNIQEAKNLEPRLVASQILKVLTAEDFELPYYKLRSYFMIGIINPDYGLVRQLPEASPEEESYNPEIALHVRLDDNSVLFVNDQLATLDDLKQAVRTHMQNYTSESAIELNHHRETSYRAYIDVQNTIVNEIKLLREELSLETYKTSFDNLNKDQKSEIKRIYPLRLIE